MKENLDLTVPHSVLVRPYIRGRLFALGAMLSSPVKLALDVVKPPQLSLRKLGYQRDLTDRPRGAGQILDEQLTNEVRKVNWWEQILCLI